MGSKLVSIDEEKDHEEHGRWKMEDGRWKMEDGRWKIEDAKNCAIEMYVRRGGGWGKGYVLLHFVLFTFWFFVDKGEGLVRVIEEDFAFLKRFLKFF